MFLDFGGAFCLAQVLIKVKLNFLEAKRDIFLGERSLSNVNFKKEKNLKWLNVKDAAERANARNATAKESPKECSLRTLARNAAERATAPFVVARAEPSRIENIKRKKVWIIIFTKTNKTSDRCRKAKSLAVCGTANF